MFGRAPKNSREATAAPLDTTRGFPYGVRVSTPLASNVPVMTHEFLSLEQLAERLGRDPRDLEKLAQRGRIPGRRLDGVWRFHPIEIQHWLEQEIRGYSSDELANVEESQRLPDAGGESPLIELLPIETVEVPLPARTRRSVLESLIEVAGRTWQVWEPATILDAVLEREAVLSTGFDSGVAIPHPRQPLPHALGSSIVAYGRTLSGIPFGAPRRQLTDIFFLVLCRDSRTHLMILARLGRLLQLPGILEKLREAPDSASSHRVIHEADRLLGTP
jgi:nitrogen PTS system EIIA component